MYANVQTSILVSGFHTDFFDNDVGLMQGEVLSPILFGIYVNDCESDFFQKCDHVEMRVEFVFTYVC